MPACLLVKLQFAHYDYWQAHRVNLFLFPINELEENGIMTAYVTSLKLSLEHINL